MTPAACPPPGEAQAVAAVVAALHEEMVRDYPPPGIMRRDAHPKSHGTVQAELVVDPSIPADLRHGVFKQAGATYRAWVRFSNCFRIQSDAVGDTRGMAVKLLGVEGKTFMDSETGTQDFLAGTGDAFFIPDAVQYVGFPQAASQGFPSLVRFFVRRRLWRGLRALLKSTMALAMNPLALEYFSQTPYRLGESLTIKFHFRPLITRALGESLPWTPLFRVRVAVAMVASKAGGVPGIGALAERISNWLVPRDLLCEAMARSLTECDAWFEVCAQRLVGGLSIEDATASWDPALSPFERVAWLRIPRQVFTPTQVDTEEQRRVTDEMVTVGERLSYNPWHAIAAHEPLGSINRARRHTNGASSEFRHAQNYVPLGAPAIADFDRITKAARLSPGSIDPRPDRDPASFRSKWAYLYLRRIPALIALATIAFPMAATWPGSPLSRYTRGIFDVQGPVLLLVSILTSLLALTVMTTWWVITAYGGARCRARCTYAVYPIRARWYGVAGLLIVPVIGATVAVADRTAWTAADWVAVAAFWAGGMAIAAVVAWSVRWLADFLSGMEPVQNAARRVCRSAWLSGGFVDAAHQVFLPGHLFAAGMAIVVAAAYVTIGGQTLTESAPIFPGLVFLILLPTITCWVLSWLTFFVDRFRVPVLLPLVALLFLIYQRPGPQHVFALSPQPPSATVPAQVLAGRIGRAPSPDAVIVVAASGGGTQSAVWTARVLTGLVERCRTEGCAAAETIAAISATSGGSVGAMAFAAAYVNGQLPVSLQPVRDHAARSGQDALWRSLVYEDLYRPLRLLSGTPDERDRGLALERAWRPEVGDALLGSWRDDAIAGRRPGLIFNATLADGERSVLLSSAGRVSGAIDFHDFYDAHDVPVVRAARLSSTFPVVVPFARDARGLHADKIIDGGYSDQFGLDAATRWLNDALTAAPPAARVKRALLLEIRAPVPAASVLPSPRWADQLERDTRGVQLLQQTWKESVGISSVLMQLCDAASTQWHVTADEKDAIDRQWQRDMSGPVMNTIVRFLKGEGEFAVDRVSVDVHSSCP